MKKLVLSVFVCVFAVITFCMSVSQGDSVTGLFLDSIEGVASGESGNGTTCTATSKCFSLGGVEMGSVSCSGKSCTRGAGWVECDGVKTKC